jgi:hypothetical protein
MAFAQTDNFPAFLIFKNGFLEGSYIGSDLTQLLITVQQQEQCLDINYSYALHYVI